MSKKTMVLSILPAILFNPGFIIPQSATTALTLQEKVQGLMTVYAEVKYNFVFPDRLKDWDENAARLVPEILNSPDVASYYNVLKRWVGSLGNGHTLVHAPNAYWETFNMPPIECAVIENRVYISRVGKREEIVKQGLRPGLEIIEIDGEPALRHIENTILPLCSYSRKETALRRYSMWFMAGPRNTPARFKVSGGKEIILRRDTKEDGGGYFIRKTDDPDRHNLESRLINGILYLNLTTFQVDPADYLKKFDEILKKSSTAALRGIILDIRENGGGNDEAAFGVAQRFLLRAVPGAISKVRKYVGAHQAWRMGDEWEKLEQPTIQPGNSGIPRFAGPLILLTGPETGSAAEDFAMILQKCGRALLVGERTAGDTGQIISFGLPQGGFLWVCTKWDFQPDGSELIGVGLRPDYEVPRKVEDLGSDKDRILENAIDVIGR